MLQSFLRVSGVLQSLRQRKFIRGRFRRQTNGFVQQLDRRIERFFLHSNHAQQMQQHEVQAEEIRRAQSDLEHQVHQGQSQLELLRRRLEALSAKRVLTDPLAVIQDKRMLLAHLQKNLGYAAEARLAGPRRQLGTLAASLDALSPLKVLGRGHSLARTGAGEILSSVDQVENEDVFTLRLSDGTLDCRVEGKRRQ